MNLIEIRIPKEIKNYREKLFFGLTLRQCICAGAALLICVPLYIFGDKILPQEAVSWLVIFPLQRYAVRAVRGGIITPLFHAAETRLFLRAYIYGVSERVFSGRINGRDHRKARQLGGEKNYEKGGFEKMTNVNFSENAIQENSITEVHNDEQAQTEVSAAEQSEYSAVSEVPEEYKAAGAEAAVSEVSEETGINSDVTDTAMTAKNAQAFLLLAGVFGVVIAAMVLKRKFQKDKRKKTADKSQLTAKERDEIRLAEKKRKKEKQKVVKKKRFVPRTTQKTLPYKCVCDNFFMITSTARHTFLRT